jgi:hypothetical protein
LAGKPSLRPAKCTAARSLYESVFRVGQNVLLRIDVEKSSSHQLSQNATLGPDCETMGTVYDFHR